MRQMIRITVEVLNIEDDDKAYADTTYEPHTCSVFFEDVEPEAVHNEADELIEYIDRGASA